MAGLWLYLEIVMNYLERVMGNKIIYGWADLDGWVLGPFVKELR